MRAHPFSLLLYLTGTFYFCVLWVLKANGLPFCLFPIGMAGSAVVILSSTLNLSAGILLIQILKDGAVKLIGNDPPPLKDRLVRMASTACWLFVLALIYLLVLIPYLNLKPAIPLLNPRTYDWILIDIEKALFGGILPTAYVMTKLTRSSMAFWDFIYHLFGPFLLVSTAVAVYYEGVKGGSRLLVSYAVGFPICLAFTLAFPTLGPLFVDREWFGRFYDLSSGVLASHLLRTVREYANAPGTVYACGGISAMPSYHVYACICGLFYWRNLPRGLMILGAILILLIWISTVMIGWHYVLDGVVAIIIACFVMSVIHRKRCRSHSFIKTKLPV